jgi:hypothetical protein
MSPYFAIVQLQRYPMNAFALHQSLRKSFRDTKSEAVILEARGIQESPHYRGFQAIQFGG